MYRIALCDDETEDLDKTEQMLNRYEKKHPQVNFVIERFRDADELLHKVKEKNYTPDICFLDIYMPKKMGTRVAGELRDMGNRSRIVFLTASREHALEAFGVEASHYLVKPVLENELFAVLDRLSEQMEEEKKKYLLLRIEGRLQRVAVRDIIYCEAQGKTQRFYFADGTQCSFYKTMSAINDMLCQYEEFARVGVAYIVNMEHIESLNSRELMMDNGKMIYPPRGSYQPLREKYLDYYCADNRE